MNDPRRAFAEEYMTAVRKYLVEPQEESLHCAYELGRKALAHGWSILDLAAVHHQTLEQILDDSLTTPRCSATIALAANFFAECVSLFEITHRGFRDTIARLEAEIIERKQTEDHLRRREVQLEEAQKLAHLGSWEWDIVSDKIHWSAELYRIFGLSPGEFEATFEGYLGKIHPDDREYVRKTIETSCRDRASFVLEERILRPDGATRVLYSQGEPVLDPEGRLLGLRGICHDITDRKASEETLRESEARYRRIVETAEEGIWVIDENNSTTFVNSKMATMLGYSAEEMIGMPLLSLLNEEFRNLATATVQRRQQITGEQNDFSFRRKDGSEFHAHISASPIFDSQQRYAGSLAMVTDITERKLWEEALQQSEELFRSLIENASDVITILNPDGTVRYESPSAERVLGYRNHELIGRYVFDLVHPEDAPNLLEVFHSGLRIPGYTASRIYRFRHKDTSWRILESVGKNLLDVPGVSGILVNSRDITEKVRLQKQLDEAASQRAADTRRYAISVQQAQEEERQRIARELHDDVCQRLSALRLHVNVLEDELVPPGPAGRKRLRSIKHQLDSMITDVRRISANLRPLALDLLGLVTALRFLCEEIQRTHKISVTFNATEGAETRYDAQIEIALYRMAQEALNNVVKHSGATRASLSLINHSMNIRLVVQDNGKGFTVDNRPKLTSLRQGFGMVSMKERAASLGGRVEIQSTPNEGTTMLIELPAKS